MSRRGGRAYRSVFGVSACVGEGVAGEHSRGRYARALPQASATTCPVRISLYTWVVLAAVAVALMWPGAFLSVGEFELKRLIVPLLQIIMFGMGSQMSPADFVSVVRSPRAVLVGLLAQFSVMPLVGLLLSRGFDLPAEIAAGVMLVGCSPSGLASNVMVFLARANVALSVTLTACATLLAPLVTPLLMRGLAAQYVPIDVWKMMSGMASIVLYPILAGLAFNAVAYGRMAPKAVFLRTLVLGSLLASISLGLSLATRSEQAMSTLVSNVCWFVVLPVVLGAAFRRVFKADQRHVDRWLARASMAGIVVIIVVITAVGRDNLLQVGPVLVLVCVLHNLSGYGIGYAACRFFGMKESECRTIALEVGMQNSGLASGIALQMGKVATLGLAPMVFGPLMNITGSSLAMRWQKTLPKT